MMEQIHKDGHAHGIDVHAGPAFIPWHRAIVNHFEELLRQVDARLSLHYWDWTTDPRAGAVPILGPSGFMGSASGDSRAPFADFESSEGGGHSAIWRSVGSSASKPDGRPDITSDADILASADFTAFHTAAKGAHDGTAHSFIGGTITQPHFSFHDPMVFLLHSNLDRLWATWQRAWPSRTSRHQRRPGHRHRPVPTETCWPTMACRPTITKNWCSHGLAAA
ncbi:tyrosinase family protein [Massilia sp. B-10]|nr:tyrosinase family protein [Massilia sp. B-10]